MIKSLLLQSVVVVVCAGHALSAHAQTEFRAILNAKLEESHANLRKAVVALGEARRISCNYSASRDCDLAKLSEMELQLLDLETKYMRAANLASSELEIDNFKKLKESTSAARDKISELADQIDKVGK